MIFAGLKVTSRPTEPDDFDTLDEIDISAASTWGWRYGRELPSRKERQQFMFEGALLQRLFLSNTDGSVIGYGTIYDADLRNGTAWLALVASPERRGTGTSLVGLGLLVEEAFAEWPLRKLYIEASDLSLSRYASGMRDGTIVSVGKFEEQIELPDGTLASTHWLELDREVWRATWSPFIRRRLQAAKDYGLADGAQVV
ncbi:MAG TPA: hypothetical protein VL068_13870 [Microthrixaceae bacterium]|nr:hypothetical protein [Microthrixaceae bacterium]